jgi:hypothetical protein
VSINVQSGPTPRGRAESAARTDVTAVLISTSASTCLIVKYWDRMVEGWTNSLLNKLGATWHRQLQTVHGRFMIAATWSLDVMVINSHPAM